MRFFLFDGELLQEYEDLLHTESALGMKISSAIEQILGMPILTNARSTLKTVRDRTESRQALAAQADQKTRQYGTELQSLQATAQTLTQDQVRHEADLANQRTRKAQIEEALRKRDRIAALFDRRERLAEDLKSLGAREALQKAQVGEAMTGAWASALRAPMTAALERLRREEVDLQLLVTRTQVLKDLAAHEVAECPTCLREIDDTARVKIGAALEAQGGEAGDREERSLASIRRRIEALSHGLETAKPDLVRARWEALEQTQRDIYEAKTEMKDVDGQIQGGSEKDLRSLRLEYEEVIRDINTLEVGIIETRDALAENTQARERLQQRLERLGGAQSTAAASERALAADLHALFNEGVSVFRDQLRRRVEADASAHFRRLTTEPDYAGLRINDSYGLTIMHKDGTEIPVRSAGAEHVVALSLVAALQNNAPMRGPIVVDSPFGRLDGEHRRRIMAALPDMASQIVLLVYEDEMPPAQARSALKGKLLGEYALVRQDAKHTEIQPLREMEKA